MWAFLLLVGAAAGIDRGRAWCDRKPSHPLVFAGVAGAGALLLRAEPAALIATGLAAAYVAVTGWALLRRIGVASRGESGRGRSRSLGGNGAALVYCAIMMAAALTASWPGVLVASGLMAAAIAWWLRGRSITVLPALGLAVVAVAAGAMFTRSEPSPVGVTAAITVVLLGIGLGAGLHGPGPLFASSDTRALAPSVIGLALLGIVTHQPRIWGLLAVLLVVDLAALLALEFLWSHRARRSPTVQKRAYSPAAASLTALLIFLIAALAVHPPQQGNNHFLLIVSAIFAVTLAKLMVSRIREAWQPMVAAERGGDVAEGPHPELVPATARTWLNGITTGIGMQLSVTLLAYQTIDESFTFGSQKPVPGEIVAVGLAVLCLALLGLPALRGLLHPAGYPRDVPRPKAPASTRVIIAAAVALGLVATTAVVLAVRTGWHGLPSLFVLGPVLVLGLDCLHTTFFDCTFMCRRWPDRFDLAVAAAAALAQSGLLYWALLSGAGEGGMQLGFALMLYGIVAIARVVLAMTAGAIMYGRGTTSYATELPVWWTFQQNEAIRTVMGFTLVWFPAFALTHIQAGGWDLWGNVLIASVPAIVLTVPVYLFGSHRVVAHVYEQRAKRFGGRFALDGSPDYDLRVVLWDARDFVTAFARWLRTASGRRGQLDDEGFVLALSANLGGQVWLRALLCASTVVGFLALLSDGLISGHPAATRTNGKGG